MPEPKNPFCGCRYCQGLSVAVGERHLPVRACVRPSWPCFLRDRAGRCCAMPETRADSKCDSPEIEPRYY